MERVNKSKQKIIGSVDLLELLDLEERGDLAERLGLRAPDRLNDIIFKDEIIKISATTLLGHILQLRQPLIRMLHEIYAFLSSQRVKGRSTTRAVILPGMEDDLKLIFDEVMKRVIATALDRRRQEASLEAIAQQVDHLTNLLSDHISMIASSMVQCETSESLALENVSGLEVIAHNFRGVREAYHQYDIDRVEELHNQMEEISSKLEQLSSAVPQNTSTVAPVVQEVIIRYARGMRIVEAKLYDMRGNRPDSYDVTSPTQRIYERDWHGLLEGVSVLKETIFAACEFEEETTPLYDFLNLEVWRDRWRIYELWMLTHIIEVFEHVGFKFDISARVTNEVWDLKFTKDKRPIAILTKQDVTLEVYYQLYEKKAQGGDMPDIAIKERGGSYFLVLDPKYGRSYGQGELGELAERYARAFSAELTVIHNFYPLTAYNYLTVSEDPACLVVSDVAPDTANLRQLDKDIVSYLNPSWVGVRTVLMVDVSGSTSSVQQRIINAVEKAYQEGKAAHSGNSLLILYSDKIEVCLPLSRVSDIRELIVNTAGGGTSLTAGLREVANMIAADTLTQSTVLIFTDDDSAELSKDSINIAAIIDELRSMNAQLKVFEATDSSDTILSAFAENIKIQYERV